MRITLSIVFGVFLFSSCGTDPGAEHPDSIPATDSAHYDSVAVVKDTTRVTLIASTMGGDTIATKDQSQIIFSFTKEMLKNKNALLPVKEVRKRFMPVDQDCDEEAGWTLSRFFYLDSLHKRGEEPDRDMGQTVKVDIREFDTIRVTESNVWVTWTMYYETFEACPYASGTYFMLSTYDKAGHLVSTQCMGRDCGGADAPISWSTTETCNIFTDGSFRGLSCDTTEDYDEEKNKPLYSVSRKTFTGQISAAGKITRTALEIERSE